MRWQLLMMIGLGAVGWFVFGWLGLLALVLPFWVDLGGEKS